MKAPKEEKKTIETEEAGVHESTLEKLKRKIRLRLLAEEARNSQLAAAKAAQENINLERGLEKQPAQSERRGTADGPSSFSRVRSEPRNLSVQNPHQPQQQQRQQVSQLECGGSPRKSGLKETVENGRTIVLLSSDDEEDVSNPSRFQQQNKHRSQRASQAQGVATARSRSKEEEQQDYGALLERVLGPLLAKAATAAVKQITRPIQQKRRKLARGRTSSSKATSKNSKVGETQLSAADSLHRYRYSVSAAAAAQRKRGKAQLSNAMADKTPSKRGRPRGAKAGTGRASRPAKEKDEFLRTTDPSADVSNSYEQDRQYNILRNKGHLQRLNLSTLLETRKTTQRTPKPKSRAAASRQAPAMLEDSDPDWEENGEADIPENEDLHTEQRVESQRSQITSASGLTGSSSAFQGLEKSPTVTDDELYEPKKEPITDDDELYEPKEEPVTDDELYEPMIELHDEDDDNSSNSSEPSNIRMRGKVKSSLKGKAKEKAPRGRPRKEKSATADLPGSQDLVRILAELLTGKTAVSLPPDLLQRLDNSTRDGGESDQAGIRVRQAALRKKQAEARQKLKRKAEDISQQQRSSSPTTSHGSGKKQRADAWLTEIPFETPKTDYEKQRDEAIQKRKDELDKIGAVADLLDQLKPNAPRQVRPYHKRWSSEPNPVFNRQTRLKERLNTKGEILVAVKEEIVEVPDEDALNARPTQPFADSLVAKFSNWATLRKNCNSAASSEASPREWDLNEPSVPTGSSRVVSFQAPQEEREQLLDPLLTRIYTMDVGVIRGQCNGLLAAGGNKGRIAVFSLRGSEAWSSYGGAKLGRFSDDDEEETTSKAPLLAWSVDSSWISQVIFLPSQFKEKEMLLLSSSYDGRVVLWDVNQVRVMKGSRELSQEGMPRAVCHTSTLHSGSIFGMHELDGRMATASEDGVGISAIRETMIFMEKCITGHHSEVIRHVRFRDKNVLADCGADMEMGILDLRCPTPCTLKLTTSHKTAMSMVEWSPGSDSVLLSASLDPQIYLHDIRNPRKSLFWHTLDGHVYPRRLQCDSVYRPTFVDGGNAVVSPGEGTQQLSLYAVDSGSAVGKVHLGYDTTVLHWSGLVPSAEGGLWAGGGSNAISHCKPIWRLRDCSSPLHEAHDHQPSSSLCSDPAGGSVGEDAPNPYLEALS